MDGRLDRQRYRYMPWKPKPLADTELARRYFRWIGPATLAEFQWFSALGVKAAKMAVEPLKLVAFDNTSGRLPFEEDREAFDKFQSPKKPQYVLAAGLDGLSLLRRDLRSMLADEDLERGVMDESGPKPLSDLADLPSHAIFDRGRLVGLWEYDSAAGSIAWIPFAKPEKAIQEAVARMETFVRDELGDAPSFSLDSPKSRVPRIKALRAAQA